MKKKALTGLQLLSEKRKEIQTRAAQAAFADDDMGKYAVMIPLI